MWGFISGLSILLVSAYFYANMFYDLITVALEVPSDCIWILGWVFLFLKKKYFWNFDKYRIDVLDRFG